MKLLFYGFLIYLLYKIIFDVVVPVSNGVKSVRQNMEQMQKQQAEAFKQAQNTGYSSNSGNNNASAAPKKEAPVDAEYIDFEEVKK
jgi:hypothetical protein